MTNPSDAATGKILIQVTQNGGPVQAESSASDLVEATQKTLVNIRDLIKESWSGIVAEIGEGANAPKEVTIEFGVGVGAEGSIPFIAKGSMNANFNVSLVWKNGD